MTVSRSLSKCRLGVVVNYVLLVLTLLASQTGHWFGWSVGARACLGLLAISVMATFFPVHVRTGLWRLVHAKVGTLDERETQQNLESVRLAYVVFTIVSLSVLLTGVVVGWRGQTQQLAAFWVLFYLAHTLPSSILVWKLTRLPAQDEE